MFTKQIVTLKNLTRGNKHLVATATLFVSFFLFISLLAATQFLNRSTDDRSYAANRRPVPSWSLDQINFGDVYRVYSGYTEIDPIYFGAYALKSLGDSLYVGLSGSYPARVDGAALVKITAGQVAPLRVSNATGNKITEQGLHFLFLSNDNSTILVPGTDPCCGDTWDFGNIYRGTNNSLTLEKFRENSGLDHVVHFWSITETPVGLFGAVSSYFPGLGPNGTAGEIFKSVDGGRSWTRVTPNPAEHLSDPNVLLSTYRISNVSWFNNRLYVNNSLDPRTNNPAVQYSVDFGTTWNNIPGLQPHEISPMISFKNKLIGVVKDRYELYVIDQNNYVTSVRIPYQNGDKMIANVYQSMTTTESSLYVLTQNWMLLKTNDPLSGNWDMVTSFTERPIAVEYWKNRGVIVVATAGPQGKMYEIKPSQVVTPTPAPTSPPANCLPCTDPRYDHDQNGVVNSDDALWFANNCLGQQFSDLCPNFNQVGGIFDSGDIMCVVRCASATVTATPTPTAIATPTATLTPIPPSPTPTIGIIVIDPQETPPPDEK